MCLETTKLPLVTVVTVTYNSAKYVRDAIESILCSSYENFELIIGDDCSTDNTWDIINEYTDRRIIKYRNENNLGEYPNRNKAINLSKGEYLIFIDGDDLIYPHGLEFMTKMLHAFPECGMALMRWYKPNIFYPVVISPEQLYKGIYFGYGFNDIAFSNMFFRTDVLKQSGGFPHQIKAGDNYIRLRIGYKYPVLLINDHLTFWRESEGQASSKLSKNIDGIIENFQTLYLFLSSNNCPLSSFEIEKANRNIRIQLVKALADTIKSRRFSDSLKLSKEFKIKIYELFLYFKQPEYKDPFSNFNPGSLFCLQLEKNPFSKNYNQ